MKYKGISSLLLLSKVKGLLDARGLEVRNIDSTIVAQEPKLAPYKTKMVDNIAETLGISDGCVNVKATTSEGLGFTGAGEGIAAYAVAMLRSVI
jgi:2-C-methyl-D-erythritol 2,4-cyclodiphosphate synthase